MCSMLNYQSAPCLGQTHIPCVAYKVVDALAAMDPILTKGFVLDNLQGVLGSSLTTTATWMQIFPAQPR